MVERRAREGPDVVGLIVPSIGSVAVTDRAALPWVLLDADGSEVDSVSCWLTDLHASDYATSTLRSYAYDLLGGEQLVQWWKREQLGKAESAILDVLVEHWPDAVPVEVIAEATGYSATSGGSAMHCLVCDRCSSRPGVGNSGSATP